MSKLSAEALRAGIRNVLEGLEAENTPAKRKAAAGAQFRSQAEAKRMLHQYAYFQRDAEEGGFDAIAAIETVEEGLLPGRGRPSEPTIRAVWVKYRSLRTEEGIKSHDVRIDRLQQDYPGVDRERLVEWTRLSRKKIGKIEIE